MKRIFLTALIMLVMINQVSADSKEGTSRIEINIPSRTLSLVKEDMLLKEYPVCVGKPSTQTPQGEYKVIYKTVNPYWINKEEVVPPGPDNPLGIRWIGITKGIGIHGNNKPDSIGTYASSGCIRMYNRDVQELYTLVPVNTPVVIKYDRIRLLEDKYTGDNVIVIFPDGYKVGLEAAAEAQEALSLINATEELKEKAAKELRKTYSKPIAVSGGMGVFLNNSLITCDAMEADGSIFMNCKAAEDILGLTSEVAGQMDIGIKEFDGRIYVNLSQTVKKYGGKMSFDKNSRNAYISMKLVKVNGVYAGLNQGDCDKLDFLAVESAKELGYAYSENSADFSLLDKKTMKQKRKNTWSLNVDGITDAVGGCKNIDSLYGVTDLKLPAFLKLGEEYFKTESIDGRLVISMETAIGICERTGFTAEAFLDQHDYILENIDLETFLEDYDYETNKFRTVINITMKIEES